MRMMNTAGVCLGKRTLCSLPMDEYMFRNASFCANLKSYTNTSKRSILSSTLGFRKFAELRPKHCILAGASGTHSVCVCTIHQNVKLMLLGAQLHELTSANDIIPLSTYHHCLARMICNCPLPDGYLGECEVCPGTDPLTQDLYSMFDEHMIDTITYV